MKNILLLAFASVLLASCGSNAPADADVPSMPAESASANEITYNVYLKPQDLRDPYAPELYVGFDRQSFVDSLFAAVYTKGVQVTDMNGDPMTIDDVKQREVEDPNYSRDKVACVQFHEQWQYSPSANKMTKVVKSMLIGYEVVEDSMIVTLRPGFMLHF